MPFVLDGLSTAANAGKLQSHTRAAWGVEWAKMAVQAFVAGPMNAVY